MITKKNNFGSVYSTEHGKMCPVCNSPIAKCICKQKKSVFTSDGVVMIGFETKGRKGKGVTVIKGIPLDNDRLRNLTKKLKKKCGTGGTVKDYVIEIQGDQRDILVEELKKQGYSVKRSVG